MGRSFVFVIGVIGIATATAAAQTTNRGSRVSSQNQFNSSSMSSGFGANSSFGSNSFGGFGTSSFGTGNSQFGQSSAIGRNTRQTGNQRTGTTRQNQGRTGSASRNAGNRNLMSNFGDTQNAAPGGIANQQSQGRTGSVVVVQLGFVPAVPAELTVNPQRMQETLAAAAPAGMRGIQVEHAAGVVTLRGQVASEHQARLAAAIASLEPGVRSVRNLLEVNAKTNP